MLQDNRTYQKILNAPTKRSITKIYMSFVRPYLDYGDIIFDKPNNESFKSRIESIQYKACIATTGAIQGISRERLYRELGLESLSDRCWFRKLTFFYKIVKGLSPPYLTKYVNLRSTSNYQTRSANKNNLQEFPCRSNSFKYSFFPFCGREWNKLDNTIRDAESIKQFKSMLNCLQGFGYNSVTLMNTNFVIISKTV